MQQSPNYSFVDLSSTLQTRTRTPTNNKVNNNRRTALSNSFTSPHCYSIHLRKQPHARSKCKESRAASFLGSAFILYWQLRKHISKCTHKSRGNGRKVSGNYTNKQPSSLFSLRRHVLEVNYVEHNDNSSAQRDCKDFRVRRASSVRVKACRISSRALQSQTVCATLF